MKRGKATKQNDAAGIDGGVPVRPGGLSHTGRQDSADPGVVIETEVEVPREEIAPDFPPVDLNTADGEELDTLPGIGESLAGRIIAYREANGPFENMEEIMEVSGIGEAKFAELEEDHVNGTGDGALKRRVGQWRKSGG